MQIWAVTLFCIGLTVLSLWYIIVEVFFWDQYPKILKESLERNDRYRLDRIIHYMIWWLLVNGITIFTLIRSWWWEDIISLMNQLWAFATALVPWSPIMILNIQLVLFSIVWFIFASILPLCSYICWRLYKWIINHEDNIINIITNISSYFKRLIRGKSQK